MKKVVILLNDLSILYEHKPTGIQIIGTVFSADFLEIAKFLLKNEDVKLVYDQGRLIFFQK